MKSKSIWALASLMASAAAIDPTAQRRTYIKVTETPEEREKRLKQAEIKNMKAKGLKEFFYPEGSVWAINQKTANKKAIKKGYTV